MSVTKKDRFGIAEVRDDKEKALEDKYVFTAEKFYKQLKCSRWRRNSRI